MLPRLAIFSSRISSITHLSKTNETIPRVGWAQACASSVLIRSRLDIHHRNHRAPRAESTGPATAQRTAPRSSARESQRAAVALSTRQRVRDALWHSRRLARREPLEGLVLVGIGQQSQVARALHGDGELALIVRLRARDPARNNLAGLGDVALQDAQILVVDLLDAFGGETAELAAAEKASHGPNLDVLSEQAERIALRRTAQASRRRRRRQSDHRALRRRRSSPSARVR